MQYTHQARSVQQDALFNTIRLPRAIVCSMAFRRSSGRVMSTETRPNAIVTDQYRVACRLIGAMFA